MNLMKWFRKNNKKVMAIVVVVIMFGFIAGPTLRYLGRVRMGWHRPVAHFADNRKITRSDLISARDELEILRFLQADVLLRMQDLRAVFLSELLFSERRVSPVLINRVKQAIRANQFGISDKQISDMYRRSWPAEYYWLLLKNEAQFAGIRVANQQTGELLAAVIPQLFEGSTYSQIIQFLMNQQGIAEEQILTTFGELLAVLQYAHMVCSNEDVTGSQLMHIVSWENETVNVELVKFDSSVFAETLAEPNEDRIIEHFNKYKKFFAGTLSEENPYGFGYKLPDRVQLEYIAVKLGDVSTIVTPPTHQETEEYYQKNIKRFTESVSSDPNDPNSPQTEEIKSYADVASIISQGLLQDKINSKAEAILQEAKALTEAGLENMDIEAEKLSSEQFRQAAGDYKTAAEQLSEKHKVKIYTGQTGLLSASDIQSDKNLAMLYRIVFAIDELKASELGPFGIPTPRMYENIGPVRDIFGQMMAFVRVIKAEPASEPESVNQTFSKNTLILDPNQQQSENVYSLKEEVAEELKRLAAMDITKSKTQEFVELVAKNGWDRAIDRFNKLYGQQARRDPNDPNVFRLQELANLQRLSSVMLATLNIQNAGDPKALFLANDSIKQGKFIEQLYSLVPQDSNTVDTVPLIMEFKPDMSFYIIKNISINRFDQMEYEKIKVPRLYREDYIQVQSMAAVHFNPENILKRMNFRLVVKDEEPADVNAPAESEESS